MLLHDCLRERETHTQEAQETKGRERLNISRCPRPKVCSSHINLHIQYNPTRWAIGMCRCSWQEHIRPDVKYRTALFKYYHGNNSRCGALLCSHKLFKDRHSDTPLISYRVMSWQHYLPLRCSSVLSWSLQFLRIWLNYCVAKDT